MEKLTDLVSYDERKDMPFKMLGNEEKGIKIPVFDIDEVCRRIKEERKNKKMSMRIDIEIIHKNISKEHSERVSWSKDPLTGIYYGMIAKWHEDGNPVWRKIELKDSISLDLTKEIDLKMWAVLRMCDIMEGSPICVNPKFRVIDQEVMAANALKKVDLSIKAIEIINSLKELELVRFGRFLGLNVIVGGTSMLVIKEQMVRQAMANPKDFHDKWTYNNRPLHEIFASANAFGIISHESGQGYYYKSIPLGYSEQEVVNKLFGTPDLVRSIELDINKKDNVVKELVASRVDKEEQKASEPAKAKGKNVPALENLVDESL